MGAAVGAAALGDACSSDDPANPGDPNTSGTSGQAAPGPSGQPTAGRSQTTNPQSAAGASAAGARSTGNAGSQSAAAGRGTGTAAAGSGPGTTTGGAGATANTPGAGSSAAGTQGTAGDNAGSAGSGPSAGKVTVAIVSRTNVEEAVARAVELAGGIDEIQPGQTVFIKPNAVSDRALGMAGIRTSNEVLAAVVRLVKSKNPGRIIVGDRSARQFPDTARVFAMSGMGEAAMAAGADEIYAAKSPADAPDEWMLLQPPMYDVTWSAAGGLYAMKKILEADHLINVPTCKNHRYALFSLSMKAFMGAIGDSSRANVHLSDTLANNFVPIGRDLAIMNQMFSPLMNVIDATTALVNGGPQGDGSDAVRTTPGLIFASRDRVALDAAAVSLIQLELESAAVSTPDAANPVLKREVAWKLPQIVSGIELGISGVTGADQVALAFDNVTRAAEIEAKFRQT